MGSTDLKELVKGKVTFQFYKDSNLWYQTESGYQFPVPIEDIGNATFLAEDKAMLFMRYIRQHLKRAEVRDDDSV